MVTLPTIAYYSPVLTLQRCGTSHIFRSCSAAKGMRRSTSRSKANWSLVNRLHRASTRVLGQGLTRSGKHTKNDGRNTMFHGKIHYVYGHSMENHYYIYY